MKKLITILLLLLPFMGKSQNNEVLTFTGITGYQFSCDQSSVFQLKYERKLWKSIAIQSGIRYHSEIQQNSYDNLSKWVQYAFNSYKLDVTLMAVPINKERLKFKTGIGFDIGLSNYYWAGNGVTNRELYVNEQGLYEWGNLYYWRYNIDEIVDVGLHFVFQGNYYFKNNLFLSGQLLYNYVFDQEVANQKYSWTLYRESPLCFSAGLGFRF